MKKGKIEKYIENEVKDHDIPSVTEIKSRIDFSKEPLRYVRDSNFYNYRSRLVFSSLITFVIGVVLCFGIVYGIYRYDHRGMYYADDVLDDSEMSYVEERCESFDPEPTLMSSVSEDIILYIYKGVSANTDNIYFYKIAFISSNEYDGILIANDKNISINAKNDFGILCEIDIDSKEKIEFSIQINKSEKTYSFSN